MATLSWILGYNCSLVLKNVAVLPDEFCTQQGTAGWNLQHAFCIWTYLAKQLTYLKRIKLGQVKSVVRPISRGIQRRAGRLINGSKKTTDSIRLIMNHPPV